MYVCVCVRRERERERVAGCRKRDESTLPVLITPRGDIHDVRADSRDQGTE